MPGSIYPALLERQARIEGNKSSTHALSLVSMRPKCMQVVCDWCLCL
jgi:hypothetical protein